MSDSAYRVALLDSCICRSLNWLPLKGRYPYLAGERKISGPADWQSAWIDIYRMSLERFVAGRYLRSGHAFLSVSTWITLAGVTLAVAVVCIAMSLHNGFEREIRSRLLGTTSHITIFPLHNELIEEYEQLVERLESVDDVVAASPFIYYKVAIQSASAGDGIILRGVDLDSEKRTSNMERDIKVGDCSFEPKVIDNDTVPGMIIGSQLAERLGVYLGEPVWLYSIRGEDLKKRSRPRIAKFQITGILETGMYEFDAQMAYIALADAQKLFKIGHAVTATHLKLTDIYEAEFVAPVIDSILEYRYDVVPWNVLHKNLFGWIEIEGDVLFLGFILIMVVAAFSIVSTLVMLTMEKRSDIGILKTIGLTPGSVGYIFILVGLSIGVVGMVLGWILALLVAWTQNTFEIVTLPPDIYFISYLPIDTHLRDFVQAGAATIVICFLASLYPAVKAARSTVTEILRK